MEESKRVAILERFFPSESLSFVDFMIIKYQVNFVLAYPRSTKLGDFRPKHNGKRHKITINNNLNKQEILFTFLHEVSHLLVWEKHKNRVAPHGQQWKSQFSSLLEYALKHQFFNLKLSPLILKHSQHPKSSTIYDIDLSTALKNYDNKPSLPTVLEIADGDKFLFNKRVFKRLNKRRKNIQCMEVATNKKYIFSPIARVRSID